MTMLIFQYNKFILLKRIHDLKWSFNDFLNFLVGRDDDGQWHLKGRTISQTLGLFPKNWTNVTRTLSRSRHQSLIHLINTVINRVGVVWVSWLRICDTSMSWVSLRITSSCHTFSTEIISDWSRHWLTKWSWMNEWTDGTFMIIHHYK